MPAEKSRLFNTTAWSLIHAAKGQREGGRLDATNRFIAGYWKPVFYFVRARGYPLHQAEDLTQDFFCKFLEKSWLEPADPRRGRFRSFLLKILTRFLVDQNPARSRRQSAFEQRLLSVSSLLGDDEFGFEPHSAENPESIFMQRWARAVIDNVLQRVQLWCLNKGRPDWYKIFLAEHFPGASRKHPSQEALAKVFRVTRDQVRHALEQAKQQFVEELHNELSDQVSRDIDIPTEIAELERLLGRS